MFVAISIIITDYFEEKNLKSISYTCNEEPFKKKYIVLGPPCSLFYKDTYTHIF